MAGIIMVMLGLLFTTVNVPLITIKANPEYHMIYNDSQMVMLSRNMLRII